MSNKFWVKVQAAEHQNDVNAAPIKKFMLSINPSWTAAEFRDKAQERFTAIYADHALLTESFSRLHDGSGNEIADNDNIRSRYAPGAEQLVLIYAQTASPKKRKASEAPLNASAEITQRYQAECRPHQARKTIAVANESPSKLKKPRPSAPRIRATSVARRTPITPDTDSEDDKQARLALHFSPEAPQDFANGSRSASPTNGNSSPSDEPHLTTDQHNPPLQEVGLNGIEKSNHVDPEGATSTEPSNAQPLSHSRTSKGSSLPTRGSMKSFIKQEMWMAEEDSKFAAAMRSGIDGTSIHRTLFSQTHSLDFIMHYYRKYEDAEIKLHKRRPEWPTSSISTPNWGDRDNARLYRAFKAGVKAATIKQRFFRNYSDAAFDAKWKAYTAQMVHLDFFRPRTRSGSDSQSQLPTSTPASAQADTTTGEESLSTAKSLRTFSNGQTKLTFTPMAKVLSKTPSRSVTSARSARSQGQRQRQAKLNFEIIAQPLPNGKGKQSVVDLSKITAELNLKYPISGTSSAKATAFEDRNGDDDSLGSDGIPHYLNIYEASDMSAEDENFEDATSLLESDSVSMRGDRYDSEEPVWHDASDSLSSQAYSSPIKGGLLGPDNKGCRSIKLPEARSPIRDSSEAPALPKPRGIPSSPPKRPSQTMILEAVEIPVSRPPSRSAVTLTQQPEALSISDHHRLPNFKKPITPPSPRIASASGLNRESAGQSTETVLAEAFNPIDSDGETIAPSLTSTAFLRRSKNAPRGSMFAFMANDKTTLPQAAQDVGGRTGDGQLRRQLTFKTGPKLKRVAIVNEDITRRDPLIEDADFDEDYLSQSHTLKEFVETSGPLFRPKKLQEQIEHGADKIRKARTSDRRPFAQVGGPPAPPIDRNSVERRSVARSTAASTTTKTDHVLTLASSVIQAPDDETCPTSPGSSVPSISEWVTNMPISSLQSRNSVQVAATPPIPISNLEEVEVPSDDESNPLKDLKILDSQEIDSHLATLPGDLFGDLDVDISGHKPLTDSTLKSALKQTGTRASSRVVTGQENPQEPRPAGLVDNDATGNSNNTVPMLSRSMNASGVAESPISPPPPASELQHVQTPDDEHFSGESEIEDFGMNMLQGEKHQAPWRRRHQDDAVALLPQIDDSESDAGGIEEAETVGDIEFFRTRNEEDSDNGSHSGDEVEDVWPKLLSGVPTRKSQSQRSAKDPYFDLIATPSPKAEESQRVLEVETQAEQPPTPASPQHAVIDLATPTSAQRPALHSQLFSPAIKSNIRRRGVSPAEYNQLLPSFSPTTTPSHDPTAASLAKGGSGKMKGSKKRRRNRKSVVQEATTSSIDPPSKVMSAGPASNRKARRKAKKRAERRRRKRAELDTSVIGTSSRLGSSMIGG